MTVQSKYAWPDKQYDGNVLGYEEHATDLQTWLIERGYDEFMTEVNPRTIPREPQNRQVQREGDPSGHPVGYFIYWESVEHYEKRCSDWEKKAKKIWAKMMRGYTGAARTTAMQAPEHDPQALVALIKKVHGDKTEKQVTKLVRKFIGREKTHSKPIAVFNREWTDSVRIMRANGMDLPDKFLVNLYLISLGPKYSTLEAVVSVLPAQERTLVGVMARAVDHNSDSDEADNSAHALIAALQSQVDQLKRGRETAYSAQNTEQVFCTNCKKPYHTKEQCWLPGGGMAHLSKEERRALLQAKKKRRTERAVSFATQKPATESAQVAQEQPENDLIRQIEDGEEKYGQLKAAIQSMMPGFDFNEVHRSS